MYLYECLIVCSLHVGPMEAYLFYCLSQLSSGDIKNKDILGDICYYT